jgi:hypothetical protein
VNAIVPLKLPSSLDTLPSGGNLDKDTILLDANRLVESNQLLGLGLGTLLVKGQAGINFSRDTTRDDGQDLLAELNKLKTFLREGNT